MKTINVSILLIISLISFSNTNSMQKQESKPIENEEIVKFLLASGANPKETQKDVDVDESVKPRQNPCTNFYTKLKSLSSLTVNAGKYLKHKFVATFKDKKASEQQLLMYLNISKHCLISNQNDPVLSALSVFSDLAQLIPNLGSTTKRFKGYVGYSNNFYTGYLFLSRIYSLFYKSNNLATTLTNLHSFGDVLAIDFLSSILQYFYNIEIDFPGCTREAQETRIWANKIAERVVDKTTSALGQHKNKFEKELMHELISTNIPEFPKGIINMILQYTQE